MACICDKAGFGGGNVAALVAVALCGFFDASGGASGSAVTVVPPDVPVDVVLALARNNRGGQAKEKEPGRILGVLQVPDHARDADDVAGKRTDGEHDDEREQLLEPVLVRAESKYVEEA